MQEEIQDLETTRQNILRRAPTNENVWVVATEYFRLFRHGYMAPVLVGSESSSLFPRPKHESHTQLDFLKATMAHDVTDGVVCGPEALLENWKLVSQYGGDVNFQLKRLEQVATDSLLATTRTSVTVTANTKLLNKRLVLRGSVRFDWDQSMGRVTRHESTVDLLTPLLELLGNLKDVAVVFDKALMTLEGKFLSKCSNTVAFN
ncbi:BZIP transcription factor [Phytophthora megakarya]|uniref:BZIP transcription factor n=1 Tax=Phytophthora megakarya TaxID=4795 RepID=A0A225VM51_9STRA|nr:BZIP transcription factor [Phytophthora megakarya]